MLAITVGVAAGHGALAALPGPTEAEALPAGSTADDAALAWGADGTRAVLSEELDRFFGMETGDYIYVREEDVPRRQPNGEFLLADQFRLPLFSLASFKTVLPDGRCIYQAFVHRVPMVRAFILTDAHNRIIAAALADMMDVKKDAKVVDVVPRVTVFYRQAPPPAALKDAAVNTMNDYYAKSLTEDMKSGFALRVFEKQLVH
jgi:hypothetical protein